MDRMPEPDNNGAEINNMVNDGMPDDAVDKKEAGEQETGQTEKIDELAEKVRALDKALEDKIKELEATKEHREQTSAKDQEDDGDDRKKRLLRGLLKIALFITVVFIVLKFVAGIYVTHVNNMYPFIQDGDLAVTFKLGGYETGDAVAYTNDEIAGSSQAVFSKFRIGRIVGKPGDVIDITADGLFTVNGNVPYETVYAATERAIGSTVQYPYTLGDGEYFVLSDDRAETDDSRMYGPVTKAQMRGKCILLLRYRGI